MALPTFFIIGAPKAGTTSLHHYLDQHPEVQMSAVKEPRFFAGPENGIPYPPDYVGSRSAYEALFDPSFAVRGESSTDYATHPRRSGVPERIKEAVPEARFVYVVRDPVARAVSHYKMGVALLGERRPIDLALGDPDPRSAYIAPSLYATQLELYLGYFPRERILVLDQADLLADRQATLREAFSFLGVDPALDPSGFEDELLSSESWRAYPNGYASFMARRVAPLFRWIPTGFRRSVRAAVERKLWPPIETDLDEGLRERLQERFAPEAGRLRELTGKPLAKWSV
jgi:hypothetical protein